MDKDGFSWIEKKLPNGQIVFSFIIIILVNLTLLVHILLFLLCLPLIFIPILLLFLNKNNYLIKITEESIRIKPRLLFPTKEYNLNELLQIELSLNKRKDTYFHGSDGNRTFTAILYYSVSLISLQKESKWNFKRKFTCGVRKSDEFRMKKAIKLRIEFERQLYNLKQFLPDVIEFRDIAPEPKLIYQNTYCVGGFCIFLIIIAILAMNIGAIAVFLILSLCFLIPNRVSKKLKEKRKELNTTYQ